MNTHVLELSVSANSWFKSWESVRITCLDSMNVEFHQFYDRHHKKVNVRWLNSS